MNLHFYYIYLIITFLTFSHLLSNIVHAKDNSNDDSTDYYEVLGLSKRATDEEIQRAYRKLSLKYHPDKNPGDIKAENQFHLIAEAYEVLKDPDLRRVYDVHGKKGLEKQKNRGSMNPFDIFTGNTGHRKGPDMTAQIHVELDDLYNGLSRHISVTRTVICPSCRGTGAHGADVQICPKCKGKGSFVTTQQMGFNIQMQTTCDKCHGTGKSYKKKCKTCKGKKVIEQPDELELVIERGMVDEEIIVFEKMGPQNPEYSPGDIIVRLRCKPHRLYKRRGNDLYVTFNMTLKEALLGFSHHIESLDGRDIHIFKDTITYPGQEIIIPSEGMPIHDFPSEKGDLHVQFYVTLPKTLSPSQQQEYHHETLEL